MLNHFKQVYIILNQLTLFRKCLQKQMTFPPQDLTLPFYFSVKFNTKTNEYQVNKIGGRSPATLGVFVKYAFLLHQNQTRVSRNCVLIFTICKQFE